MKNDNNGKKTTKNSENEVINAYSVFISSKKWNEVESKKRKLKQQYQEDFTQIEFLVSLSEYNSFNENEVNELSKHFGSFFRITEKLLDGEKLPNELFESVKILSMRVNFLYERAALEISHFILKKTTIINEKSNKLQSVQFATFSIFLTMLSFVMANVILISKEINVEKLVLGNLSILLFASVLFAFIGIFLNLPYSSDKTHIKVIKYSILIGFPILIMTLIIYFCNFFNCF